MGFRLLLKPLYLGYIDVGKGVATQTGGCLALAQ